MQPSASVSKIGTLYLLLMVIRGPAGYGCSGRFVSAPGGRVSSLHGLQGTYRQGGQRSTLQAFALRKVVVIGRSKRVKSRSCKDDEHNSR